MSGNKKMYFEKFEIILPMPIIEFIPIEVIFTHTHTELYSDK